MQEKQTNMTGSGLLFVDRIYSRIIG